MTASCIKVSATKDKENKFCISMLRFCSFFQRFLYHKNLESPEKYRYNSNHITACVCVLIIKGENEKDVENFLEDNNWMFSLKL